MDRRKFLQSSAAAASALTIPTSVLRGSETSKAAREPRKVGLIGCGWYGKVNLIHLLQVEDVEVVSVCDVDSDKVKQAAILFAKRNASGNRPQVFGDYRKQLEQLKHDLIIVGTPDHWHALPTIAAMESGAHVYCEKPTACDVLESKAMLDTARRLNRKLQIGTQRRQIPHLLTVKKDIVEAGLLGDIGLAEMCCYYHMRNNNTLEQSPDLEPPPHLDYEMWTGPAPMKPYNGIIHPKGWRAFMEYGNGIVGDMCVHLFDMTRWMLDLGWPKSISSSGGVLVAPNSRANITDTQNCTFKYDDVELLWTHRTWGAAPDPEYSWATVIYGAKGTLKLDFKKFEFIPRGGGKRIKGNTQPDLENFPQDQPDHKDWDVDLVGARGTRALMKDWLAAIDNDTLPIADIKQGHISSASCILANLSLEVGRTLHWDPDTHQILGDQDANKLLQRPYRKPWTHPAG